MNKLLVVIAILVCLMFVVVAEQDAPQQTLIQDDYGDLFGYGYYAYDTATNTPYIERNDYYSEVE